MLRAKEFQVKKLFQLPAHLWCLLQIGHLLASYAILKDTTGTPPLLNSPPLHGPPQFLGLLLTFLLLHTTKPLTSDTILQYSKMSVLYCSY